MKLDVIKMHGRTIKILYWYWLRNTFILIFWMVNLLQWLLQKVEERMVGFGLSCLS